jgi:hypothetical protein
MRNTVRRQLDSTLEEEPLVEFDSTEPSSATPTELTGQRINRPRRAPSHLKLFFREKWPELLICGLLLWLSFQVFSLNREVGRLDTKVEDVKPMEQRLEQRIDGVENRFRDDINRLQDRIDRQQAPQTTTPPVARPTLPR